MVAVGLIVGLVSSFFGVGACFIMVPAMIYFFETFMHVSSSLAPLIAFGTNMAIVSPTSLSGVIRHLKELKIKDIVFPTKHYLNFGLPAGVGSFLGSLFAFTLFKVYPAQAGILLKTFFGLFCIFGAYRFMAAKPLQTAELKPLEKTKYAVGGLAAGFIAHFVGIGGGIIYLPILNSFLLVPIHLAVPVSLATMALGSLIGALSFGLLGHLDQLYRPEAYPPLSFGWFNLVAFLSIGLASIASAQIGPKITHKVSPKRFKILLAALYIYIGVRLILRGIFQLQGLIPPIP
jgi:hypothetical protein